MPAIDFKQLRSQVQIAQVLELLDFVPRRRRGDQLRGPCPLHRSQSATSRSFSVNLKCNAFHCFVCGEQGNQLDLWVSATGLPLHDAAVDLCNKLGVELPRLDHNS